MIMKIGMMSEYSVLAALIAPLLRQKLTIVRRGQAKVRRLCLRYIVQALRC